MSDFAEKVMDALFRSVNEEIKTLCARDETIQNLNLASETADDEAWEGLAAQMVARFQFLSERACARFGVSYAGYHQWLFTCNDAALLN